MGFDAGVSNETIFSLFRFYETLLCGTDNCHTERFEQVGNLLQLSSVMGGHQKGLARKLTHLWPPIGFQPVLGHPFRPDLEAGSSARERRSTLLRSFALQSAFPIVS